MASEYKVTEFTVAKYLKLRLEELGLDRMFGVAGNYTAAFLNTILADKASPIAISGNANEICAGYAADGYARLKGISALFVTYSVGAFSLLNTIAGSFTEQVPLVLINGAPTNKEDSVEKNAGLLYAHTTGTMVPDIQVFRSVAVAAERITNARQAPFQIDSVLTALLTYRKPVYLEVTEDVWRARCIEPREKLASGARAIVTVSETDLAVQATMALVETNPKVVFWAGIELQRFGLQDEFLALLQAVNRHADPGKQVHFVTAPLSKSVVSEEDKNFEGCLTMTQDEVTQLVGTDGCLIGIGAWTTGKDTSNENIRSNNTVFAAHESVWVGALFYPLIELGDYIAKLEAAFLEKAAAANTKRLEGLRIAERLPKAAAVATAYAVEPSGDRLTYDNFFSALGGWITPQDTIVSDAGFPLVGAQSVKIARRNGFVAQAAWLAIGYSVGAATGVKFAQPDQRVLVVVGDGAFHETCQAVADHVAYGQNTVVFVLVNGLYGIEQEIVNPNPFRTPPVDYPDPQLDHLYPYNRLHSWHYDKIPEVFGGIGRKAGTVAELLAILQEIREKPDASFVVEITLPTLDVPAGIAAGLATDVGEDEFENPNWPPEDLF